MKIGEDQVAAGTYEEWGVLLNSQPERVQRCITEPQARRLAAMRNRAAMRRVIVVEEWRAVE